MAESILSTEDFQQIINLTDTDHSACLKFVTQFGILGDADGLNCPEISKLLYKSFLNKFNIQLDPESYEIMNLYQDKVYEMIGYMHEMESVQIKAILKLLDEVDPGLADIVLMSWCLPRSTEYLSQTAYNEKYKSNIKTYNKLLTEIVDFYVVKNFCSETLTKTNYVPVHCIDLLWYYMNGMSLEFTFGNDYGRGYIGIKIDDRDPEFTIFNFNMEYLLLMGLGKVSYEADSVPRGLFRDFLKRFVTDAELARSVAQTEYHGGKNFIKQLDKISANPITYFGEDIQILKTSDLDL